MTLASPQASVREDEGRDDVEGVDPPQRTEANNDPAAHERPRHSTPPPVTSPFAQLGDALAAQVMPLIRDELSNMETRLQDRIDDRLRANSQEQEASVLELERQLAAVRLDNAEAVQTAMVNAQVTDVLTDNVRRVLSSDVF